MYGIINKAIEELVISNFGKDKWEIILAKSGIEHSFFISNETYDDAITYQLAQTISQEMNMSIDNVMIAFGEWWVVKTTRDKYSGMMQTGGSNLKQFLINLPVFHNRIMLHYPKLTPPEFKISHIEESNLCLHYFSKREGLQEFVRGLIQGLGIIYSTETKIELLKSRSDGSDHEIFKISW